MAIDLTAACEGSGRARLLVMALEHCQAGLEGLSGPGPLCWTFHVVHLAGKAMDRRPRRAQQQHGHRDQASDPLYREQRLPPIDTDLLTGRRATMTRSRWSGPPLNRVRPSHNPIQPRS